MNRQTIRWIGAFATLAAGIGFCQPQVPSNSSPTPNPLPPFSTEGYCQSLLQSGREGEALKSACIFSLSLAQHMPNFVCEMSVEKYEDITRTYRSTQTMQKIHAQARYVNGKDYYDDLEINGKLVENTNQLIEGTWSFGEFGAKLLAAFNPKNHPKFSFQQSTKVNGVPAFEYEYHVEHQNNRFWRWVFAKRSALPGYVGKVWVSKQDGTILRLQLDSTQGVPDDFPIQTVESKTDYSYVDFKDRSGFILPSSSRIVTRMLDRRVYRTNMSFSHCKRFTVNSHVVLDASQK